MIESYKDHPFAPFSEKEAPKYSPEDKIWRPVIERGQDGKDEPKRLASETMRSIEKGPLGLSRSDLCLLRDNFTLSTWLLIGACLQGAVLMFCSLPYAILPAILILTWRILDNLLQIAGIRTNPNMANVILGKFSVHSPNSKGELVGIPAQQGSKIVYFLTSRCNHPLGMFAPGYKEVAEQFEDMIKALEKEPEKYGYYTSTAWIGRGADRTTSQDIMHVFYFDNLEGVHRFAHSPVHRIGWEYLNQKAIKYDYISFSHEIYITKESEAIEGIYGNYHRTGYSGQNVKLADGSYVVPLVDASEGQYKTSKGRLNLVDHGKGNDRYYEPTYQYARLASCPVVRR